jgi:hypothetical protein
MTRGHDDFAEDEEKGGKKAIRNKRTQGTPDEQA